MSANLNIKVEVLSLLILTITYIPLNTFASLEIGISNPTVSRSAPALHSPQIQSTFINTCLARGIREQFCRQITSPNTNSARTFGSVYGSQPFVLMPPQDRWETGLHLLTIAESLSEHAQICQIRNWYRPEPYNRAVSGARGSQHLSAGAIDIEFCSVADKNRALRAALAMRQRFQTPPGVGVYGEGSLVIHIDMSNRIYGPGIAYADRAAAQESVWASVRQPGSNLQPNPSAALQNAITFPRPQARPNPSPNPAPERQRINTFFRQILSFFTALSS